MKITVSSRVVESPRVLQVRGLFDLPEAKTSTVTWEGAMPLQERAWHIGLIVGPSGSANSTTANSLWPERVGLPAWAPDRSILDGFPDSMPIQEVAEILSAVGF